MSLEEAVYIDKEGKSLTYSLKWVWSRLDNEILQKHFDGDLVKQALVCLDSDRLDPAQKKDLGQVLGVYLYNTVEEDSRLERNIASIASGLAMLGSYVVIFGIAALGIFLVVSGIGVAGFLLLGLSVLLLAGFHCFLYIGEHFGDNIVAGCVKERFEMINKSRLSGPEKNLKAILSASEYVAAVAEGTASAQGVSGETNNVHTSSVISTRQTTVADISGQVPVAMSSVIMADSFFQHNHTAGLTGLSEQGPNNNVHARLMV